MYYGDSKASVYARKTFLPSFIRNIDKEEWAGGFENLMQDVKVKGALVDKIFKTDLAKDKEEVKEKRKEARQELKLSLAVDDYKKEYNALSPLEKYEVDKKAESEALKKFPTPNRENYNKEQDNK